MKAKLLTLLLLTAIGAAAILYDRTHTPAPYHPAAVAAEKFPLAPHLAFTTLDGRALTLAGLKEPAVVLHFWASWCAPCLLEFPALLRRAEKGDVAIVAISIDDDPQAMRRFLAKLKQGQPAAGNAHVYWVWDQDKKLSLGFFDTVRVPESVLIDRQRRMTGKLAGDPGWDSPAMTQELGRLVTW